MVQFSYVFQLDLKETKAKSCLTSAQGKLRGAIQRLADLKEELTRSDTHFEIDSEMSVQKGRLSDLEVAEIKEREEEENLNKMELELTELERKYRKDNDQVKMNI